MTRLRSITLLVALGIAALPALAQTPGVEPAPPQPIGAAGAAAEPIPILYHARCLYVPVRIGNAELTFLLDTGASASAIDSAAAERLDLPAGSASQVEGTAGVIDVATCRVARLSLGAAHADDLAPTVQDLSGLLSPPGRAVEGILGHDVLRRLALRIDFANRTLLVTVATPPSIGSAAHPAPDPATDPDQASSTHVEPVAVTLPFTLDKGIPRVKGVLDGVATDFRLDTGASLFETDDVYINVTQDDWARLQAAQPGLKPESELKGSGAGGEVVLPVVRLRSLALGTGAGTGAGAGDGIEIARPYAIVQPRAGYFARPDAVGFLSNNLLEKFSPVTIDYRTNTLTLTRPAP